jgi:simple sugar transport system permease protein
MSFVSEKNIQNLLIAIPEFSTIVLGVGLLMIAGEYDLSVGSIIAFSMFVLATISQMNQNLFLCGLVVLGVGSLLGLLNGLLTVKVKIPSFITTLGTMMLWRGVTYLLTGGYAISFDPGVSRPFEFTFTGVVGSVPIQAVWFAVFGLILGVLLHFHKFGNWIYATGDNKTGARSMGVNTDQVKIICFMIVGFLCAFTAMGQTIRIGESYPLQGQFYELKAIAGSVIGGSSLFGGIGTIPGIFLGAILVPIIENGLVLLRVQYYWVYMFYGVIILFFVLLDTFIGRKRLEART